MKALPPLTLALTTILAVFNCFVDADDGLDTAIRAAFQRESFSLDSEMLAKIRSNVWTAHADYCSNQGKGSSKAGFAAVEVASSLGVNPKFDSTVVERVRAAIEAIPCDEHRCISESRESCTEVDHNWEKYFSDTLALNSNAEFLRLVSEKNFSPVKISWEDIGRFDNSVWGDRISDVGIWVRRREADPQSAELALSVRRDNNYRDKVLVVPAERIKIHLKDGTQTRELTLPQRLKELDLLSKGRDTNVIVSNQFAIVPVPASAMNAGGPSDQPPRAAFTFSIYPYGSTNYVITDVIEGSSDAIVGPGGHQLLFANKQGERAPFTASRAKDRKDLLELESELKRKGMDVDVQRYYLIQVPLNKGAQNIENSNMGGPPQRYRQSDQMLESLSMSAQAIPEAEDAYRSKPAAAAGLDKVAIGTGQAEGKYFTGSGFRGQRAEEPVRVTVVYFVTPVGEVTRADMQKFSSAFEAWDSSAIWGGSFVTKES